MRVLVLDSHALLDIALQPLVPFDIYFGIPPTRLLNVVVIDKLSMKILLFSNYVIELNCPQNDG